MESCELVQIYMRLIEIELLLKQINKKLTKSVTKSLIATIKEKRRKH